MGGRWRALKPGPSGEGAGSGEPPGPPRPDPRAVVARGWTRRCGCCSIRLCPGSSVRSREAWGPALPGRRPWGPRVFPRGRRRPPQRAPSPAGASAAEPARRTRARSPPPAAAVQIRTAPGAGVRPAGTSPWRLSRCRQPLNWDAAVWLPRARGSRRPPDPFVWPSRWQFGEWLGQDLDLGVGAKGRGGPLANAKT